jgi:hypothetical protein
MVLKTICPFPPSRFSVVLKSIALIATEQYFEVQQEYGIFKALLPCLTRKFALEKNKRNLEDDRERWEHR